MNERRFKKHLSGRSIVHLVSVAFCLFCVGCSSLSAFAQSAAKAATPLGAALLNAIHEDRNAAALAMIAQGANINTKDERGNTALMYAIGHVTVLKTLLSKGAMVNVHSKNGDTALLWTVFASNDPISLKLLLEYGADVNARGNGGQTALMRAVNNQRLDLIEMLLRRYANLKNQDENGRTAFDLAELNLARGYGDDQAMNLAIIHRLRRAGAKGHKNKPGERSEHNVKLKNSYMGLQTAKKNILRRFEIGS